MLIIFYLRTWMAVSIAAERTRSAHPLFKRYDGWRMSRVDANGCLTVFGNLFILDADH